MTIVMTDGPATRVPLTSYERALVQAFREADKETQLNILSAAMRDPSVSGPLVIAYRVEVIK